MQFKVGDMVDLAASFSTPMGRFEVIKAEGDKVTIRDRTTKKVGVADAAILTLFARFGGGAS